MYENGYRFWSSKREGDKMDTRIHIAIIIIAFMSIIGFVFMGVDKAKAKKGAWRISEKTLLGIAFLGGGAGVWLGMELFRHKTKHLHFKLGVPAITLLEFIAVCYVFS